MTDAEARMMAAAAQLPGLEEAIRALIDLRDTLLIESGPATPEPVVSEPHHNSAGAATKERWRIWNEAGLGSPAGGSPTNKEVARARRILEKRVK